MLILQSRRDKLLDCLPKAGRVAEIGVYTADFSECIYEQTCPMELHLIDPWMFQDDEDYKLDDSNVPQDQADRHYDLVCQKFAPQIEAEIVQVHRDFSENAVKSFADEYFDWVYIDANHTYEACLSDLRSFAPKVKSDGFICGHDYANHSSAKDMHFGVVEAVNQFVGETGFELSLLTFEPYPSYVISKTVGHDRYKTLVANALLHCGVHTEVQNAADRGFQQQVFARPDGSIGMFYSFA